MKRTALVFPLIAVALAVVVAVLAGPFSSPRVGAASSMAFEATFATADDFYGRFDHGYSGLNPHADPNAVRSFHGDHNTACEGPTTDRTIGFGGSTASLDYSQLFWHCAPGNDPAKGHIMTGVDTVSYNIGWFSPKQSFQKISKVCWDQNLTTMSKRKWTQVVFVTGSDLTRFPAGVRTGADSEARGSGGYDLGFTSPEFRGGDTGPSTRIEPVDAGFAGLKIQDNGKASWFNRDDFTTLWEGSEVVSTDKATRYKHCIEQSAPGEITFTQARPGGTQVVKLAGTIPQGTTRVVFQDDNYDPAKDDQYQSNVLTWHWDNVQVFTDPSGTTPTTASPTTPTTKAPTTPAPSTPSTPAGPPTGSVDVVQGVPGAVSVAGWALDPDTASSIPVHVYVGAKGVALEANGSRPDVGAVFPGYGSAHGFGATIPVGPGTHQVCAYAINVGVGSNVLLGCRAVTVPSGSPVGSVDVAQGVPGGVSVAGWALDPDTASSIPVHVYVDERGVAVTANQNRPDVGAVFPAYGPARGFSGTIAAAPGPHNVCAYGINTGGGGTSVLGCRVVVVPGGAPIGALDVAVGGQGKVTVSGWAIDPDTTAPIEVHVYVGSAGTALVANGQRPDVGAVFPAYGAAHGYGTVIDAAPGTKLLCAYGINTGTGGNSLLGCRIVTIT